MGAQPTLALARLKMKDRLRFILLQMYEQTLKFTNTVHTNQSTITHR